MINSHPTEQMTAGKRIDVLISPGGIQNCGKAANCQAVCPKEIPLMTSWGRAGRAATVLSSRTSSTDRKGWNAAMINLKRVYESPSPQDGLRVLVDRLWPRGLTKERAAIDLWVKDVAPSTELRKWFGHDPAKWKQFQIRYRNELHEKKDALQELKQQIKGKTVTLVYGARDEEHNEALVLKKVLERRK